MLGNGALISLGVWIIAHFCSALGTDTKGTGINNDITLYVSTDGDDHWSGTIPRPNKARTDGPLASVNQAAALSKKHKDVSVTVKVAQGTYYLAGTLSLDSSYSR